MIYTNILERYNKLSKYLEKLNIKITDEDVYEGEIAFQDDPNSYIFIQLDNGMGVTIYYDEETEKYMFDVGYDDMVDAGDYWNPPDYDFIVTLKTQNFFDALKEMLLRPKIWDIDNTLEQIDYELNK